VNRTNKNVNISHRFICFAQCENCEKITGGLANMGRGAASAEGGGWRGGVPSPIRVGPGEGAVPPPQKFF